MFFAEESAVDVAASMDHLSKLVKRETPQPKMMPPEKEKPSVVIVPQATGIKPIQPQDLEKLNHSIDPDEDVHVVSVDYENGRLKHMKVDAFVVNNDIQLSTTYVLSFEGNALELTIEDYLTGLENTIPETKRRKTKLQNRLVCC